MCPDSEFFFKRLDLFMHSVHTHDSKFRYMINITLPQWLNSSPGWDSERGGLCSHLTKEDMPSSFSNLAVMVLDVSFINTYNTTAGFLFFDDKQGGCKENWQQCGEGEGLPHRRPCGHQQPAALPQRTPDPHRVAVSDDQLGKFNHWENNLAQKLNFNCCSAAILFPVRQIHEDNSHWQQRRLPHNMFSGNSFSCMAKSCKVSQQRRLLEAGRELPHRKRKYQTKSEANLSFYVFLLFQLCLMRSVRATAR